MQVVVEVIVCVRISKENDLSTGRAQGAIWGDSDCVDVAGVAHQVTPELAVCQVPHLHAQCPDSHGIKTAACGS